MKRLWVILFVVPLFAQETEKEDPTFVLLKSGEIKQVQKSHAYIEFVNPLNINFEIIDTDSVKYDIEDIQSIKDSKGKIAMRGKTIFLMRFIKSTCQILVLIGLVWISIY